MASPLVLGRLASMALTFALPLLLARLLDASAFGRYKELFLVAQTVLLTCQLGFTQSLYYFLPRERERRGAYVAQVVIVLGALALVVALVILGAGPAVLGRLSDGGLMTLATPLAFICGGMLASAPLEAALTSEGRVGSAALAYVLSDGLRAALLLLGARHAGLPGLAWAGALWACARVAALAVLCLASVIPIGLPRRITLRAQAAYAIPFAGSIWLYVAQKQFLQFAVASRETAAAFALFSVAAFHLPVVDILYTPIAEVLMVQFGRSGERTARLAAWDDAVEKLASILWPATICAWLFGATVLPMLFTDRYRASIPLFMLATAEIPLWILPVDALLRAAGRTRFLLVWYAARVLITGVLVVAAMRLFGLRGAIVGGVISEAISRMVMVGAGRRMLGVPLGRTLDPALLMVALSSLLAAIPALCVLRVAGGVTGLVWGAVAYLTTYGLLHLKLRRPRRREGLSAASAG